MIPWTRPSIGEEEAEAVAKVMKSGWLSMGFEVKEFEEELANYLGAKYVVCVSNGTMALTLCYLAVKNIRGFKRTENLVALVSNSTFSATASVPVALGIKFVPVGVSTVYGISTIEDFIEIREKLGNIPSSNIIYSPVHLLGQSVDISSLKEFLTLDNSVIIEDGCQALGSSTSKGKVGSDSEFCAFSFHQAKIISTVEGGCISTNNKKVYENLLKIRNQGLISGSYHIDKIGINARMTDINAAIGRVQLKKISASIERRVVLKSIYDSRLSKFSERIKFFTKPNYMELAVPGLYAIKMWGQGPSPLQTFLSEKYKIDTRRFFPSTADQMYNCGVEVNFDTTSIPNFSSRNLYGVGLLLPMGNAITEEEVNLVCDAIEEYIKNEKVNEWKDVI